MRISPLVILTRTSSLPKPRHIPRLTLHNKTTLPVPLTRPTRIHSLGAAVGSKQAFHTTTAAAARRTDMMATQPVFSEGYPAERGERELAGLVRGWRGGDGASESENRNGNEGGGKEGKWRLISSGMGVERSFRFKSFKKTWEFMNAVAAECALKKHHPEWSNVYNTTFIRWTTHSPAGLSEKDILMARFCDEQALVFGEVQVQLQTEVKVESAGEGKEEGKEEGEVKRDVGKELADRVAREGGECCVPKSLRKGGSSS